MLYLDFIFFEYVKQRRYKKRVESIRYMELNMKFIYIENYLSLKKEVKLSFFKFINGLDKLRILNQKVVLNDDSIILELSDSSNEMEVKAYIESFFKNYQDIRTHIVTKLVKNEEVLILTLKDKGEKRIEI